VRKRVLLVAGGTGGHIFPARRLKDTLQDEYEMEMAGVGLAEGVDIPGGPLSIKSLPKIVRGIAASDRLLQKFSPDLVIGFGSYHSFPTLLSAYRRKIPICLYEANRVMGRVNALFSRKAKVFSPLPNDFATTISFPHKPLEKPAYAHYDLDPNRPTILVLGGSQGAKALNEQLPILLDQMEGIQVLHLTGKSKTAHYQKTPATILAFEEQMERAYSVADFVIARAGASTVTELLHYKIPSLLIPLPSAIRDHQTVNALYLQNINAAKLLPEKDLAYLSIKEIFESKDQMHFPEQVFPLFADCIANCIKEEL